MFDRQAQLFGAETRQATSVRGTLIRLGRYFRHYVLALVVVAVAVVGGTYMQVLIPDLTGQAVDCYLGPYASTDIDQAAGQSSTDLLPDSTSEDFSGQGSDAFSNCWFTDPDPFASAEETIAGLGQLVLLIVGLYIGSSLLSGAQFYLMSWAGFRVLRDLRSDIFQHLHRLSLGFFSTQEAGDVMSRVTNDIDTLQQVIGFGLVSVLQGILLIAWIVVVMFGRSVPYALISLVTLPLMLIATQWLSRRARRAFRIARVEIGAVTADLQENIAAVREVQAFSREDENIEQFRVSNAATRDANIQAQAYSSALGPTLEALSFVSLAVVAVVGGLAILGGQDLLGTTISIGLIITFIGYTQQFNRPVQQIAVLWTNIQSAIAGAERIFGLLDENPDISDKQNAIELPKIEGEVQYHGVWAEYTENEPVLKGVDIKASPGQTVAIVGPTGAGKTTIIKLLPRF